MAGFLYFVPGKAVGITPDELQSAGLGYALQDGRGGPNCGCAAGPDGSGVIVSCDPSRDGGVGYYPDKQQWRRVPGSDAFVGMERDNPPKPGELARTRMVPGHWVRLAAGGAGLSKGGVGLSDGNDWLIPVARAIADDADEMRFYSALPTQTGLDDDGNWVEGQVVARHAELWEIAQRWWDALTAAIAEEGRDAAGTDGTDASKVRFDFAGINDAALVALATNYRVSKAEIDLLGAFDAECVPQILGAVVDWPTVMAWNAKKNAAARSPARPSTPDG